MTPLHFFPTSMQSEKDAQWQATNLAVKKLVYLNQDKLSKAMAIADAICRQLKSIFPLLDELVRVACPWCPEQCCIVNKVWIDFQDLLFWHLIDQPIPVGQLNCGDKAACRYLNHRGCILPRLIRPWTCTLYVCATQNKCLAKIGPLVEKQLNTTIQLIKDQRIDMETEFIKAISKTNVT